MLELHVREFCGDLDRCIHEAERGRVDQGAAGASHALDGALGIRAFRHAFEERRLDLVVESLLQRLASDIVRLGPATVGLGTDIDEADLLLFLSRRATGKTAEHGSSSSQRNDEFFHFPTSDGV
ncbi:hypothetical protein D3C87_1690840 [compost metagenome]